VSIPDRELVRRIAAGDQASFAALYRDYSVRLYRYALVRSGSKDLADDALQETMLAAWRSAGGFRGESSLATWLFGICHNVLSHLLRRSREAVASGYVLGTETDPWPGEDGRLDLLEALCRLDEGHRTAVFLVYYQEFSVAEAAAVMGVPEGTVKSRLFTARGWLRRQLQREEYPANAISGER